FMFGTGGSALISKTMGEGNYEKANRLFSLFVYVSFICGAIIAVIGIIFIRPIAILLGAEGQMLEDCIVYGRIILLAIPAFVLQMEFQSFFVTAEKPQLGLIATVASGVANMVLDALLVWLFPLGLIGAASATAISQLVGTVIPVIYFSLPNDSLLRLGKTRMDIKALLRTCANGSSELMSNISMSLVGMLYNVQLYKYAGEDGVAAYGVLMYVNLIFLAVFIGYVIGTAPVVGYHYGAQNHDELKSIRKKSLVIIGVCSLAMVGFSILLARPLSKIFVGYDAALFAMTVRGFFIYSFSFLFAGIVIFGSSFFTALNNGLVSAIISFLRTMVFQIAAVIIMPILLGGIDGIWVSIVVAELMAAVVTTIFLLALQKKYHY
ncbi:MAG: MATE family efflux transporter, partial [Clostridia bacterium]|nr:MATE family efflux transporter [Clostridia bacterium]